MKYNVRFFCTSANFPYLNACDCMSAIEFPFPDMLIGVRDNSFLSSFHSSRNRGILVAGIDAELLPLYVYATADVLS